MRHYTLFVIILAFITCFTFSSNAQFNYISNYGNGDGELFFVNDSIGYSFSSRTIDGGLTWTTMTPTAARAIYFTDALNGHKIYNTITGPPAYLRTTDGGVTWVDYSNNFPVVYGGTDMDFPSVDTGYVIRGDEIYMTTDTGNTWSTSYIGTGFLSSAVKFVNTNHGFVIGKRSAGFDTYLHRTINAGQTWDSLPVSVITGNSSLRMSVVDSLNIFLVNISSAQLVSTHNGGTTWNVDVNDSDMYFVDVNFPTPDTGYVTGSIYRTGLDTGLVLKTTDGGISWNILPTGYNKIMGRAHFISGNKGWIVGAYGDILRTTNGGISFVLDEVKTLEDIMVYPNPSHGRFVLEAAESGYLVIYDLAGREMLNQEINKGRNNIVIASKGTYILRTNADKHTRIIIN